MKSNDGGSPTRDDDNEDDLHLARVSLSLQDFSMAKFYAGRALKSDALPPADQFLAEQILAIALVHIAATSEPEPKRDWYAVLQLGNYNHNICTPDSLFFSYRRLAHLLDPVQNRFANASSALELVSQAYSVLSDPEKKSVYDAQIRSTSKASYSTFWTVCYWCFYVHQYELPYKGMELRCPTCKKVFVAAELPVEPPIVEGADMYYCTWGFFPLGFPDGYRFQRAPQEEKAGPEKMDTPRPPSVKRARQTARKTVRAVSSIIKSKSFEGDDEGDGADD